MKNLYRRLFGRLYWAQYSKEISYRGSWKKGNFHGLGKMKYTNGTTFTGSFKNGAKHGYGHIKYTNGYQYNGNWIDGHQTGFGEISYKNGDLYEGGVQNGLRHREGRLFKASTCTWYEGSWLHGTLYGHVIISSSNWIFEGQLPEANEVSNGKINYPDGSSYEGQILNFKRSGKGTLTDPAGGKTHGVWKDQLHVTNAIRTDSEGIIWKGTFKNQQPDGFMRIQMPNGQGYDGVWEHGEMVRVLSVQNKTKSPNHYVVH
jgi:hypothetical protein